MQSYLVVILQTPVLGSPMLVDPHLSQQHADLQDAVFRLQQEVKKPKASPQDQKGRDSSPSVWTGQTEQVNPRQSSSPIR